MQGTSAFPSEHQLALISAIAEHRGITAAAHALSISQPAVTTQLQSAERALGTALFKRSSSGLVLTPAGESVLTYAHRKESMKRSLLAELAQLAKGTSGTLIIGGSTTPSEYYLPLWIRRFSKRYPSVDTRLWIGNSNETIARLQNGLVDLAMVGICPQNDDLRCQTVATEDILIFTATDSAFDQRTVLPAALKDATFVMREPTSGTRIHGTKCLANLGIVPRNIMEVSTNEAVIRMVEAGLGVGLLSARAIERSLQAGQVVRVRVPKWKCERELYLVRPANVENVLAQRFAVLA